MFRLGKLSAAVISANAAIVTTLAAGSAHAAPQEIEEVIVTATKRAVPAPRRTCFDTGDERKFPSRTEH